ncbi:hypothetical protein G7072_08290 [Nocardioides sp. HDW12B]|uniref:acVLRF1 family peptidyl-tRNA hydrolase n=1 Tax=Nocardioides sp. HDW12B TaxID=2714939 RepID=UPI00140A31D4|nr:acVLRF1 family peptidyl-tRNA hydrolase [Nocardioides sp. HDW12B]QIK66355.1 hypothetical protein G7072_08290 [Nocardioides sp. HDW12B]
MTALLVPAGRVVRWCANFADRHGPTSYAVVAGALTLTAEDGSTAGLRLPLDEVFAGEPTPEALADAVTPPAAWGVLLVRKGGFAVARLAGERLVEHKIGQRHVQGRTKAGGQSQQRFARRRDNQARAAYEAAAEHAARILGGHRLDALVVGGDAGAVDTVLEDTRLARAAARRTTLWLPVGDPKRAVLDQAVQDALAVRVDVTNA